VHGHESPHLFTVIKHFCTSDPFLRMCCECKLVPGGAGQVTHHMLHTTACSFFVHRIHTTERATKDVAGAEHGMDKVSQRWFEGGFVERQCNSTPHEGMLKETTEYRASYIRSSCIRLTYKHRN
jgi:hypothetical protein